MEAAERERAAEVLREEVLAERDQLVADLRKHWPRIEAEMLALLWRIKLNDLRMKPSYGPSAEALARNCSASFYENSTPVKRLGTITLPAFNVAGDRGIWPAWPPERSALDRASVDASFVREQVATAEAKAKAAV